jgi:hypothetical protein
VYHETVLGEVFLKMATKMKIVVVGSHAKVDEIVLSIIDGRGCQKMAFRNRN